MIGTGRGKVKTKYENKNSKRKQFSFIDCAYYFCSRLLSKQKIKKKVSENEFKHMFYAFYIDRCNPESAQFVIWTRCDWIKKKKS